MITLYNNIFCVCVCEGGRDLLQTKKDGDEKAEKKKAKWK